MRLPEEVYEELDRRLAAVDAERLARFPGERPGRQLYGGVPAEQGQTMLQSSLRLHL